jgi:hypothetical protein
MINEGRKKEREEEKLRRKGWNNWREHWLCKRKVE